VKTSFTFKISYFDQFGELFLSTLYDYECETRNGLVPEMRNIKRHIEGLRKNGGQGGMPGGLDERYPYPILIEWKSRRILCYDANASR